MSAAYSIPTNFANFDDGRDSPPNSVSGMSSTSNAEQIVDNGAKHYRNNFGLHRVYIPPQETRAQAPAGPTPSNQNQQQVPVQPNAFLGPGMQFEKTERRNADDTYAQVPFDEVYDATEDDITFSPPAFRKSSQPQRTQAPPNQNQNRSATTLSSYQDVQSTHYTILQTSQHQSTGHSSQSQENQNSQESSIVMHGDAQTQAFPSTNPKFKTVMQPPSFPLQPSPKLATPGNQSSPLPVSQALVVNAQTQSQSPMTPTMSSPLVVPSPTRVYPNSNTQATSLPTFRMPPPSSPTRSFFAIEDVSRNTDCSESTEDSAFERFIMAPPRISEPTVLPLPPARSSPPRRPIVTPNPDSEERQPRQSKPEAGAKSEFGASGYGTSDIFALDTTVFDGATKSILGKRQNEEGDDNDHSEDEDSLFDFDKEEERLAREEKENKKRKEQEILKKREGIERLAKEKKEKLAKEKQRIEKEEKEKQAKEAEERHARELKERTEDEERMQLQKEQHDRSAKGQQDKSEAATDKKSKSGKKFGKHFKWRSRRQKKAASSDDDESSIEEDALAKRSQEAWESRRKNALHKSASPTSSTKSSDSKMPSSIKQKESSRKANVSFGDKDTIHHFEKDETDEAKSIQESEFSNLVDNGLGDALKDFFLIGNGKAGCTNRKSDPEATASQDGEDMPPGDDDADETTAYFDDSSSDGSSNYEKQRTKKVDDRTDRKEHNGHKKKSDKNLEDDVFLAMYTFMEGGIGTISNALGFTKDETQSQATSAVDQEENSTVFTAKHSQYSSQFGSQYDSQYGGSQYSSKYGTQYGSQVGTQYSGTQYSEEKSLDGAESNNDMETQNKNPDGLIGYASGLFFGHNASSDVESGPVQKRNSPEFDPRHVIEDEEEEELEEDERMHRTNQTNKQKGTCRLEEDARLVELAIQGARSMHQIMGLVFDDNMEIDIIEDVKFAVVELKLPLGIIFQEDNSGCWVTKVMPNGNAARHGGVLAGDQLAAVNGQSAIGMKVDEICALIASAAKLKEIELTFLRYVGPFQRMQQQQHHQQQLQQQQLQQKQQQQKQQQNTEGYDVEAIRRPILKPLEPLEVPSQRATPSPAHASSQIAASQKAKKEKKKFRWFGKKKK